MLTISSSRHTPTPIEIQAAVRAKETRPQARGRRSSSKAATSRRRAKSDTASMCIAATPSEEPSLPIDVPPRSVPAPRFQAVGSYSSLDDIVSMGRSTGLVGQEATTEEGKGHDLACQTNSSQRSPNLSSFGSNHELAFTSGSPQANETFSWQAQQQARAPQHVFQALPHQRYSPGTLSFNSALSAQISYRIDQNDMQRSFDPVHGLQATQSLHPLANSYPGVQATNMFNRPRVYSASARPDVSFSQPFDSHAYTSFSESPSSSPINQSYGQTFYSQNPANGYQGMDLDSPFGHQSFAHSDMG
ncbi:hypothetical protein BDV97DRAFT_228155 [Delphinella strobiligena]|nr:hypothetical protein BDV97DRAFT_228155 [Delphinella strobiligena]